MTPLAVLFMTAALISVTALTAWCYFKVMTDTSAAREDEDQH